MNDRPFCGYCHKEMTPQNSRRGPELFLCDDCYAKTFPGEKEVKTPQLHELLFPSLKNQRWGYINFGEESFAVKGNPNPLLTPEAQTEWVQRLHARNNIEFSYGGYLEDRSNLWRGHYMAPGATWHLGIDYNVPAGTPIHLPCNAPLIASVADKDQNGGWGGKLIFKRLDKFLIFGHLAHKSMASKVGFNFVAGDLIGHIGESSENGNWFPHLHLQVVAGRNEPREVDGYSKLYSGMESDYPRPDRVLIGE